MQVRTIKPVSNDEAPQDVVAGDLERLVREYLNTKDMASKLNARLDEMKQAISKMVEESGYEDEKGNLWLPSGNHQCKREKRVSIQLDEKAAEEWAREEGIWDDIKVVQERLDVDKLAAISWEVKEYAEKVESFTKEKITWAFKVIEGKAYDES